MVCRKCDVPVQTYSLTPEPSNGLHVQMFCGCSNGPDGETHVWTTKESSAPSISKTKRTANPPIAQILLSQVPNKEIVRVKANPVPLGDKKVKEEIPEY